MSLNGAGVDESHESAAQRLADAAREYSREDNEGELGALKQFTMPPREEEARKATERFSNEIRAL